MRRLAMTVVLLVCCWGCGIESTSTADSAPDADAPPPLAVAFCNDLEAGYTTFQILRSSVKDGTYSPRQAAELANEWARAACPAQLRTNAELRDYLEGWDISPD